jgi:FKBP-type peptidyl-prolyl cis-trans isomerase 2
MKSPKIVLFCIVLLLLVSSCKTIEEEEKELIVEVGKTITFDYAAGFDNGTLFDTTFEAAAIEAGIYDANRIYQPITIEYGKGFLFPGLEESLLGMKADEIRNVRIPPNKAYGNKLENSTFTLNKTTINNYETLKINDIVTIVAPEGNKINTYVIEIMDDNILVDLNHPLAGEYVQFSIIVNSIE